MAVAVQSMVYFEDTYLSELDTSVLAIGERDGAPWVAVADCLFHPQGGGQPADRGRLDDHQVVPTRDHDTGLIVVFAAPGSDPAGLVGFADMVPGRPVRTRIDLDLRRAHAALHTAGHLIEAVGRAQGWVLAGNNHFPGQARIEFTAPPGDDRLTDPASREQVSEVLRVAVADAIAADVPVRAELDEHGTRVVHLGDLHTAACGGTHVTSLGDLAEVDLDTVKVKKGKIKIGYRAQHRAQPGSNAVPAAAAEGGLR